MKTADQNTKAIKTLGAFDKKFFPKAIKRESLKQVEDPKIIGYELAKKSLRKIKCQISKE